jgi:hypothetical protein
MNLENKKPFTPYADISNENDSMLLKKNSF